MAVDSAGNVYAQMLIAGRWTDGTSGSVAEVEDPATGERFGRIPLASPDDVNRAVEAADKAFAAWSALSPAQRAAYLHKAADLVRERETEIATLLTREQGKPLNEALGEVRKGAEILHYYAEEVQRVYGRIIANDDPMAFSTVVYEPVGVTAAISPWNYPIELIAWKIGAGLAAGCPVILKPPLQTPLSPAAFVKCVADAGVPEGVMSLVFGSGSSVGTQLVTHPLVKKVAFTGSTEVGRRVAELAAQHFKKVSLELGGSCPLIVSRHANLDEAVKGAVRRTWRNMGQVCIAINRIFVHQDVYDEFMAKFVAGTSKLTIANGLKKPDADLGPMASADGLEKVREHIADAVAKGATIAYGGDRPKGEEYEKGYFFTPTVLTEVTPQMQIMTEETFGPAVGVMPYRTLDEAVEYANATRYGLACYVYTDDLHEAHQFARRLQAGNIAINSPDAGVINAPYGGFKESGIGYEHGPEGLFEYLKAKHVRTRYFARAN